MELTLQPIGKKCGVSNDTVVNSLQFAPKVNPNLLFEKSLYDLEYEGLS